MTTVVQLGEVKVDARQPPATGRPAWAAGASEPVASITYLVNDLWLITIERELLAPTGGPTSIRIEPAAGDDVNPLGGYDTGGIQQADIRAIPISEARKKLEAEWVEYRAAEVIAAIPEDFRGDYAFARLAEAVVTLHGWNIRNPVGLIAKNREPHTHNTWATRVKRARSRGYLTAGPEPALTGRSLAMLRGSRADI